MTPNMDIYFQGSKRSGRGGPCHVSTWSPRISGASVQVCGSTTRFNSKRLIKTNILVTYLV